MNDIDAYLAANRVRFTREALTERLVVSGHDPAEVEAAWARLDQDATPEAGEGRRPRTRRPILRLVLVLAVIAGYVYVGFYGIAGISFSVFGFRAMSLPSTPFTVIAGVYAVAMLIGLAYSIRRTWRAAAARNALDSLALALVASGGILIGINGLCVVGNVAYMGLG